MLARAQGGFEHLTTGAAICRTVGNTVAATAARCFGLSWAAAMNAVRTYDAPMVNDRTRTAGRRSISTRPPSCTPDPGAGPSTSLASSTSTGAASSTSWLVAAGKW
jgi:hypothetical protein